MIINNQKTFFVIIYLTLLMVTLAITIIMFCEYRCFKHEAQELAQVKEAYYQHVDMLKRSLNASMVASDEEEQETDNEKKKIIDASLLSGEYALDFSVDTELQEPKV